MSIDIREVLKRVPQWATAVDALRVSALGGGITNSNYRVDIGAESFVLRIGGANTEFLGIDRRFEYAASMAAAELGIGAEVFAWIEPEGYLVTRFIRGQPLSVEEIHQHRILERVTRVLKQVHALNPPVGKFCPFRAIAGYAATAGQYGVALPENFEWLAKRLRQIEYTMGKHPHIPSFCHNDLLNANFLRNNGSLHLLDWEYAGIGNLAFDLANFAAHHEFSESEDLDLLTCYFGEPMPERVAAHKLMKIVSDLREAMWAVVQMGISRLDFDFAGYAGKHFGRAVSQLKDPRYSGWLCV